jgi:hypothetical protein
MIRSPRDLNELCHWFACDHKEHECRYCAEGENPMGDRIGSAEIVKFSSGREVSGRELMKHSAGQTLTELAKQHMARKKCSFSDALHAVAKICPGEFRAYLDLKLPKGTSGSYNHPTGGGKEFSDFWFRERAGWTASGVRDWIKQQGFTGGKLERNEGGWSYILQSDAEEFPR